MKAIIKNIQLDTKSDKRFPVNLLSGSLYRARDGLYYVHGSRPIGDDYAKEVFNGYYDAWDDETLSYVKHPTEWTEFITLLSADDVINLFIEEISKCSVIIKDAEFLLKYPIITTGHTKVHLDNCIAHLDNDETGFIEVNSIGTCTQDRPEFDEYLQMLDSIASIGSTISRSRIRSATYYKYGSRYGQPQIKRHWPENTEYHFKVNRQDQILESSTDKRGYPQSCGKENREKGVTVIVHNDVLEPGKGPIQLKYDDRVIGVSKDQNIIVVDKMRQLEIV